MHYYFLQFLIHHKMEVLLTVKQNQADHDLYSQNAKISALSS